MKFLLDTQAFLWAIENNTLLSKRAKKIFIDPKNELFLSMASIWEIAIKLSLKKLTLKQSIERFIPGQLQENSIMQLSIDFKHIARITHLPFHHRDPFDRLIIAQALEENLPIISTDTAFDAYDIKRIW